MKAFWESKINWAAFILILIAVKDAIANLDFAAMSVKDWIVAGFGISIIVLRTWFTNTSIGTK